MYARQSLQKFKPFDDDRSFVEFMDEVRQLIQQYPGIENRNLSIGRTWDVLHYLLSYQRCNGGEEQERDGLVTKAILGGEILNPAVQKIICIPIRYLSPIEVYEIQDILETVDVEMLGIHWNPVAMKRRSVYKSPLSQDDDYFRYLQELFVEFKTFYASVSDREGVLTFMT